MPFSTRSLPIFLAFFAACFFITNISCNRISKSSSGTCVNGGVCDGGKCICPTGYTGNNCETISRNAFLGNWTAFKKDSVFLAEPYPVSISQGKPAANDITIANLLNAFTTPINGYVVNDSLFIPYQELQGYSIRGSGALQANHTIVVSYVETTLLSNLFIAGVITLH